MKVVNAGLQANRVVFWLVREVTQQPDPTVLPTIEVVQEAVQRDVAAHAQRIIDRRNGPAATEEPTP